MSLLEVDNLSIRYGDEAVVSELSFAVAAGESVGLVGESGSGKTQMALAILGLLPGSATVTGKISLAGIDVVAANDKMLDELRARRAAIVFQDPLQALNPFVRVGSQLRRILIAHNIADGSDADLRVIDMLRRVGLPDPKRQFRAYPHQLSGGMRQRAMIAAALTPL